MFTRDDVVQLGFWLVFSYWQVCHRSPWGLWTTEQRRWYNSERKALRSGLSEHAWGTLWLFTHGIVGTGCFAVFRHGEPHQTLYGLCFAFAVAYLVLDKVWKTLFWDYRDAPAVAWLAAAAMVALGTLLGLAVALAVQLAPLAWPWVAVGCFCAMVPYHLYVVVLSAYWAYRRPLNRKDARLKYVGSVVGYQ